jgi:hypothetical protein
LSRQCTDQAAILILACKGFAVANGHRHG